MLKLVEAVIKRWTAGLLVVGAHELGKVRGWFTPAFRALAEGSLICRLLLRLSKEVVDLLVRSRRCKVANIAPLLVLVLHLSTAHLLL